MTYILPQQIVSLWNTFSNVLIIHLPWKCFKTRAFSPKLNILNLSFKTVSPPLTFVPSVMITDNKSFSSLWSWLWIFGMLLNNLPPITTTFVKQVFPILHFLIFLFCFHHIYPLMLPIFLFTHIINILP